MSERPGLISRQERPSGLGSMGPEKSADRANANIRTPITGAGDIIMAETGETPSDVDNEGPWTDSGTAST